ncbi:hypothetical protein J3U18_07790 [Gilliamella sp. B3482]|uniref:hypothetical protein n=1 Tax=Gilliamella sp. B3482 TaxID=2817991 RepID=UPI00226AF02E|nr:hypothetical protein [Gilliamella sp. B3482]MCX8581590.1 hypothetical protein [Gilliamella sp. B3482]
MNFKSLLIQISPITILIVSVLTQNEQLLNIYIALIWLISMFSLIVLPCLVWALIDDTRKTPSQTLEKIKTALIKNKFNKSISLLINVASLVLIAYSGWIVTAIFYATSILLSNLLLKLINEIINNH